jgi:high-affinity nickel permease
MRQDVGYLLLALFVIALATSAVLFVRHRRLEHDRVWGRRKRR